MQKIKKFFWNNRVENDGIQGFLLLASLVVIFVISLLFCWLLTIHWFVHLGSIVFMFFIFIAVLALIYYAYCIIAFLIHLMVAKIKLLFKKEKN